MEQDEKVVLNDRYELIEPAGSGGMSTVYKARDMMLGRTVALKILHAGLTSDASFLRQFHKEAHAAANLAHPNIVTVHDIGQDGRRYYIVMEYVQGWTLKELIHRYNQEQGRPFHLDRTLDVSIQICAAVGYAHRANLVHCDVKSQNVLVTSDGRVKVTDFGIARAISETSLYDPAELWGTPQYFSPEQAAGEPATPASDVYSIGVIMFEMLTAQLPFEADSHTALALKHIYEPPPEVTEFNPAVPAQINRVVAKLLAKEPAGRYRTADQLGSILISYRKSTVDETGPVRPVEPTIRQRVSEQKTVPYIGKAALPQQQDTKLEPIQERNRADVTGRAVESPDLYLPVPEGETENDWTAIALSIVALVALLGLIPLWYIVFLRYTG